MDVLHHQEQEIELSHEEREIARHLWQSLMFAPSVPELQEARQALKQAPAIVQKAIMTANIRVWSRGRGYLPDRDYFG